MNTHPQYIQPSRPAWVSVDLSAIRHNVNAVREHVGPDVGVLAVVKANAYGHGLVPVSEAALAAGAAGLAVAIPDEGITLREAGVTGRILIMGICEPSAAPDIVHHNLEATVSTTQLLDALAAESRRQQSTARIHVKIDSGMGRVGLIPDDAADFMRSVSASGVEWSGLMTHFATADEEDLTYALEQWSRFRNALAVAISIRKACPPLVVHAANSASACRLPQAYHNLPAGTKPMVRSGLLIYGIPPAPTGPVPPTRPALSLKARITQARNVPAGTSVSYGATFTTSLPSRLAIVPLGYADGYSRANSNRASVLLRGKRAPVVGRVCMDQFVIDATGIGAEVGDDVVLIGCQGEDEITVLELAEWGNTIHHEVLTRLSARLPRIYEPV